MVAAVVAPEREVRFRLYPVQDDFVHDPARYVAFVGGRNSGKTYAGSCKALMRAARGGLGVVAAPDFPMLEHGAKRQFLQRLDEAGVGYLLNQQKGLLRIAAWDAEVLFATLETESRVRSPNFAWGWADEIDYLVDRDTWRALKGAVRAGTAPQLFVTSTPKGRRRIIYPEWVADADALHSLHRATSLDNPFVDAVGYVASLGYAGAFYRQEIEATFEAFEGLVYPMFDRERHVRAVDCEGWAGALGVDAGVRNPSAVLTLRHAGDARHVEREVYRRGMGGEELLAAVRAEADRLGPLLTAISVDPSAAALIVDLLRLGYPVVKANNDVRSGIRAVTTALADGMTVDPSCVHTIAEYESYAYPEGGKAETDTPVKAMDHAMDAIRYAIVGLAAPRPEVYVW